MSSHEAHSQAVAIVGLACRFPGAEDAEAFWQNIVRGVESIAVEPGTQPRPAGQRPTAEAQERYVHAYADLQDADQFDAAFFEISPREAELLDPQQRVFLECCHTALEDAGARGAQASKRIGMFAGAGGSLSSYLFNYADAFHGAAGRTGGLVHIGNDKDFLATRASFKLDLRGPSVSVQTACSTSLVAVHFACQSLLAGECELAVAGGVTVRVPSETGYLYEGDGILSPDGHCRPFDADAQGTVFGSGVGVVVLKPLAHAVRDGDVIYAQILGSAVNNDGGNKISYTASSVDRQAEAIAEAMAVADVAPESIGYVEAHGTGTSLGDPLEVSALSRAFRRGTAEKGFCALGSVKANIGHAEAAAGIAGLLKVVLALRHRTIPPQVNLSRPNPRLHIEQSPFYLATTARPWPGADGSRRASVNSLGIGGTNAHVIVGEAPAQSAASAQATQTTEAQAPPERSHHVLTLSAKSQEALHDLALRYATQVSTEPTTSLPDLCYSANTGRQQFEHRLAVCARSAEELQVALTSHTAGLRSRLVWSGQVTGRTTKLAMLFTGQGSQYHGMAQRLFETEPVFREALLRSEQALSSHLDKPLPEILFETPPQDTGLLDQTRVTQPALFAVEFAMAKLWQAWGVQPQALLGHSVGEYVAACIAGVFSLEEALTLLVARGQLMQALPAGGGMLAVMAGLQELQEFCRDAGGELLEQVSFAALNGPQNTVLSGNLERLLPIEEHLRKREVSTQRLKVSHAFHSPLMRPMLEPFRAVANRIAFKPPQIPILSNLTGQWALPEHIASPEYWCEHILAPVLFHPALLALHEAGFGTFLEVGPHPVLASMAQQALPESNARYVPSMRRGFPDTRVIAEALAALHVQGMQLDWRTYDAPHSRRRIQLPTYPFQHKSFWANLDRQALRPGDQGTLPLYRLHWQQPTARRAADTRAPQGVLLIVTDHAPLGQAAAEAFAAKQVAVETLLVSRADLAGNRIGTDLAKIGRRVDAAHPCLGVLYLPQSAGWRDANHVHEILAECNQRHCLILVQITRAVSQWSALSAAKIWIATQQAQAVLGSAEVARPAAMDQAALWGLGQVLAAEWSTHWGGLIDLDADSPVQQQAACLTTELLSPDGEDLVAWRGAERYVLRLAQSEGVELATGAITEETVPTVHPDRTYLITGGLGALGLQMARWLVSQGARHLVLVGRRSPSEQAEQSLRELRDQGASVQSASVDTTDAEAVRRLRDELLRPLPPLAGLIHAAGVALEVPLVELDASVFDQTAAPKIAGAYILHETFATTKLDFFWLFSSVSSVWGAPKLGAYAAGNAFMDALAQLRRAEGLPATSINWGPWANGGMSFPALLHSLRKAGVQPIAPAVGRQAAAAVLRSRAAQLVACDVVWQDFPLLAWRPMFADFRGRQHPVSTANRAPTAQVGQPLFRSEYQVIAEGEREERLRHYVTQQLQALLGSEMGQVHAESSLTALGFDSLMSVDLRRRFRDDLQVDISARALLQSDTPAGLAGLLKAALGEDSEPSVVGESVPREASAAGLPQAEGRQSKGIASGDPWLITPRPRPDCQVRLFCFPYAGGGPGVFRSWGEQLPSQIEVCAVQSPGRGTRTDEAPLTRMQEWVTHAAPALARHMDKPFVFFGHCLGAILMYEVARYLRRHQGLQPEHFFVSAAPAPQLYIAPFVHLLSEAKLLEALRLVGFTATDALLEDADMRQLMLPTLRGDFQIVGHYLSEWEPDEPFDCPITSFAAWQDLFAPPAGVGAWESYTRARYSLDVLSGDHYFLDTERNTILDKIKMTLGFGDQQPLAREERCQPTATMGASSLRQPPEGLRPTYASRGRSRHSRLLIESSSPTARYRLVCFPHAGSDTDSLRHWAAMLPSDVDLCTVSFPSHPLAASSREGRWSSELQRWAEELADKLLPLLDRPYAMVGHCLGAIVMYEVLVYLLARQAPAPLHVFPSAAPAPHLYVLPLAHLQAPQGFEQLLRTVGYSPTGTSESGGEAQLNSVRNHFRVMGSYVPPLRTDHIRFPCPVTAFGSWQDLWTSPLGLGAWRTYTNHNFELRMISGDHYQLVRMPAELLRAVTLAFESQGKAAHTPYPGRDADARAR